MYYINVRICGQIYEKIIQIFIFQAGFNPSLHFVSYMIQYTYFHIFFMGMVLPLHCWGVTDMIHCNGRYCEVVNKHVVSYGIHIHIM
jgi:hypothetical protein